jgi:hypothetical protein
MCRNFAAQKKHTALALSEQEMWHSWQSAEENDFFLRCLTPTLQRNTPALAHAR